MKCYIDQSGKVEYTSHDTVVACSNGKKSAIAIKAKDKREIQKIFRQAGKGSVFVYRLFSALIFLLIKDFSFKELIIDTEYPGKSDLIKNYLIGHFRKHGREVSPTSISFRQIGKNCKAHWHGYYVFKGKRKAEKIITVKEILQEILY